MVELGRIHYNAHIARAVIACWLCWFNYKVYSHNVILYMYGIILIYTYVA